MTNKILESTHEPEEDPTQTCQVYYDSASLKS